MKKIFNILYKLIFYMKCDNCKTRNLTYDRTDIGPRFVSIEVYKCKNCNKEYI